MAYKNSAGVKFNKDTELIIRAAQNGTVESCYNLANNTEYVGGQAWTRLGGGEVTVNATTTTQQVATFSAPELLDKSKIGYIRIRDKAGLRNNHCVGSDTFLNDFSEAALGVLGRIQYKVTDAGNLSVDVSDRNNTYGVYVYSIDASGNIRIDAKKSGSYVAEGDFTYDIFITDFPAGYPGIGE